MTAPSQPAYTTAQRARIVAIGAVVPAVIVGIGVGILSSWADLPDPIAVHWGAGDTPEGFGSVAGVAVLLVAVVVGFGVLASAIVATTRAGSTRTAMPGVLLATSVGLGIFLTVGIGGTVAIQRGLEDAADAGSPAIPLLVAFVAAIPFAVAAWFATPRAALVAARAAVEPTLDLRDSERAVWVRAARPSAGFTVAIAGVALLTVGFAVFGIVAGGAVAVPIIIVPAVVLAVALGSLVWRVRVDAAGVVARAAFGLPRYRIPVDSIAAARVIDVDPVREFGGWGVRYVQGGVGIVLRGGEALDIRRVDGRRLVVTVDDATTAAALVNALVARSTAGRQRTPG